MYFTFSKHSLIVTIVLKSKNKKYPMMLYVYMFQYPEAQVHQQKHDAHSQRRKSGATCQLCAPPDCKQE